MWDKSNCFVICTLFKITFLEKSDERGELLFLWPLASFQDRYTYLCILSRSVSPALNGSDWTSSGPVTLRLLADGWHRQPLNEVMKPVGPNILVEFVCLPHRGTSLHNTSSICLELLFLYLVRYEGHVLLTVTDLHCVSKSIVSHFDGNLTKSEPILKILLQLENIHENV